MVFVAKLVTFFVGLWDLWCNHCCCGSRWYVPSVSPHLVTHGTIITIVIIMHAAHLLAHGGGETTNCTVKKRTCTRSDYK